MNAPVGRRGSLPRILAVLPELTNKFGGEITQDCPAKPLRSFGTSTVDVVMPAVRRRRTRGYAEKSGRIEGVPSIVFLRHKPSRQRPAQALSESPSLRRVVSRILMEHGGQRPVADRK